MSSVREILDPQHTLPPVQLRTEATYRWDGLMREKMAIMLKRTKIGHCDAITETSPNSLKAHFDGIEIDKELRGRGIGLAAYLLAIESAHGRGLPFETQDHEQSFYARKVWEHLADAGVAEVVEPFQPSPIHRGRFLGKYRVPLPSEVDLSGL